jgi:hypothetical protein
VKPRKTAWYVCDSNGHAINAVEYATREGCQVACQKRERISTRKLLNETFQPRQHTVK